MHAELSCPEETLQSLGLLCIESEILRSLNFDDIVQDFSNKKSRRQKFVL